MTDVDDKKQVKKAVPSKKEVLDLPCEWSTCTFHTSDMDCFVEHVNEHIRQLPSTRNVHVCDWRACGFSTLCCEELTRHVYFHAYHVKIRSIGYNILLRNNQHECKLDSQGRNLIPELAENFRCGWNNCQEIFTNAELFYRHVYRHAESTGPGKNPIGGVICLWESCTGKYQNQYKLCDHLRSHTQEKVVACPTCGALFSNRTKLLDHIKRQIPLDKQEHRCSHCSKRFSSERLLRDHMRTHVNHYKCCFCDMTCPTPSSLNNHIRYRHSDSKPYNCEFCEYSCKSQSDLNRHLDTHSTDPPYICYQPNCNFSSRSSVGLATHKKKVHGTGEMPRYLCHICEKSFSRGNYLTNHLIKKHKFRWPSGHSRFRYRCDDDGFFRLQTVRYESIELTQQMMVTSEANDESQNENSASLPPEGSVLELPVMLQGNEGDIVVTFEQDENGPRVVMVTQEKNN